MEQPLLSAEKSGSERWSSYEHVGRSGSAIPTASVAGTEVSVDEIRSAAAFSEPYPPSLHAPLLSSPERLHPSEQAIGYPHDKYYGHLREHAANVQRQVLDEVEIRELLIDHVGHRCCWGSRPARTWTIHAVEDCNVYVGTLETFVEERETVTEKEPFLGGDVDGRDKGPELGIWELDLRSEFPEIFTSHKELRTIIPHSEAVDKCSGCGGRGSIVCPTCNADQEPSLYKANQMSQCAACNGRGLIAHKDGSDTICQKCNGKFKAVHDGKEAYFMLQVDGNYAYTEGESNKCASVALMFQIGENASYHRMGGCEEGPDSCTNKTCQGHEVDIMHFSLGNAIPGRLYGGNPVDNREGYGGDRFGHLVDVYGWNPHCRFLDGLGPSGNDTTAQNDWQGSWWHSSLTENSGFIKDDSPYTSEGQKGTYYFEFSRPLRTMDRRQQDAQFTIGKTNKLSAAFWYPIDSQPWHGSGHYSISCDWILLDFISDGSKLSKVPQRSSWDAATVFSLLFSTAAFCISIFIGYRISRTSRTANFIQMENLQA